MSRLYDSVSYGTLTAMLNKYAESVDNIVSQWGQTVGICHAGDNVDIRSSRRHESAQNGSSYDLHLYNNVLFRPRTGIDYASLDDTPPVLPSEWTVKEMAELLPYNNDELIEHLIPVVAERWAIEDTDYQSLKNDGRHSLSDAMTNPSEAVRIIVHWSVAAFFIISGQFQACILILCVFQSS